MMAASVVGICNSALIKIGAERITSISENKKSAILCNEQYAKCRDEVLRAHPWNFALKRVSLGQLSTTPAFGYAYQYQLPSDCLRVLRTDDDDMEFKIEGRTLLTDWSSVMILYIAQIADTTQFDSNFCEALSCRLARDLAYSIAQSVQLGDAMDKLYEKALRQARTSDAQEGTPDSIMANDWIDSRN